MVHWLEDALMACGDLLNNFTYVVARPRAQAIAE
jgi:hypothetical protein